MYRDETDVKDKSNLSQEVFDIKTTLIDKMKATNYKIQREISYMDETIGTRKRCRLEDL
jgi:hypothetical protein